MSKYRGKTIAARPASPPLVLWLVYGSDELTLWQLTGGGVTQLGVAGQLQLLIEVVRNMMSKAGHRGGSKMVYMVPDKALTKPAVDYETPFPTIVCCSPVAAYKTTSITHM